MFTYLKRFAPQALVFCLLLGVSYSVVHAQASNGGAIMPGGTPSTGGATAPGVNQTVTLKNPFAGGDKSSLIDLLNTVVQRIVLPLGSIAAVLGFIWSGFLYVSARGNPGDIKNAENALLNTVIGTAILLGAWVIADVIVNTVKQLAS